MCACVNKYIYIYTVYIYIQLSIYLFMYLYLLIYLYIYSFIHSFIYLFNYCVCVYIYRPFFIDIKIGVSSSQQSPVSDPWFGPMHHQKGDTRLRGQDPQAQLGKDNEEQIDEPRDEILMG